MSTGILRVLITGVTGQVGGALLSVAEANGFIVLPVSRGELDLVKPESVTAFLSQSQPDIVVNCAAFTAVDQAEKNPDLAFAINAEAPAALARWCGARGRSLIQLSTDYVFPGDGRRPYREEDSVGPVSVYGASKLEGERRVRDACERSVIVRTAWVYAADGKNFVRTMLRLGKDHESLNVVSDQRGCPTAAGNIAQALCAVLARIRTGDAETISGTYHYVDDGDTTWCGFADHIFTVAATHWGHRTIANPITTDQYPTAARRPVYSVLDTTKFQSCFGIVPPHWQASLDGVLADIFSRPGKNLR